MKVYPAIDILEGKAVSLRKGRRDEATVYSDDPASLVADLVAAGAERIHVCDLDGAFTGTRANTELIAAIIKAATVPIALGGGIRDRETLDAVLEMGAQLAVIGTAAVKNARFVKKACRAYPERVVVAVDADANGYVHIAGWTEKSDKMALDVATRAVLWGAAGLLYTDISRSGTKVGANVQAVAALANTVDISVIGSGGVAALKDLGELAARGVPAAVVRTALYDKDFTLEEAIKAVSDVDGG